MPLAQDLMGLGMPSQLALQVAVGGSGPLTITAAGSSFATATKILANQTLAVCTNANSTLGVSLPTVGSDAGALLGDQFIIANANTTDCLKVFSSSGVVICVNGSNTSSTSAGVNTSLVLYPVSTTQWVGVS